jgi:formate dehydrogenase major subunit
MTNGWTDIKNAKLIMVIGANPAENHPSVMQYVNQARANGAKLLVVDPRRTRLAAQADYFLRIRPGTDIAVIMGAMKNAIDKGYTWSAADLGRWTDAAFRIDTNNDYVRPAASGAPTAGAITDSDSVWQALTTRVSGYTAATVADITGTTTSQVQVIIDAIADSATGRPMHPGTILYAMGATQHSYGSQQIRSYAVLQTIMGNMGKIGGGVNAMRGIHNVQGSTDMGVLKDTYPAYTGLKGTTGYRLFLDKLFGNSGGTGLQQEGWVNMIHHWFRQAATPRAAEYNTGSDNYNYDLVPGAAGLDHRTMFANAKAGTVKGMFILGENPAVSEPNAVLNVKAGLTNLDWLVVAEVFDSETASCTRKANVGTNVGVTWLIPSCTFAEETGSIANSARVIQWRNHISNTDSYVLDPKPNSKTDIEILMSLAWGLCQQGAMNKGTHTNGTFWSDVWADDTKSGYGWNFDGTYTGGMTPTVAFNQKTVAENIHKQMCDDNQTGGSYGSIWIYKGVYKSGLTNYGTADGNWSTHASGGFLARSRSTYDPAGKGVLPRWAHSWIVNRRVMYNRIATQNAGAYYAGCSSRSTDRFSDAMVTYCATCASRNVCNSPGDNLDVFVAPDTRARLWLNTQSFASGMPYSSLYRAYSTLNDSWQAGGGSGADWRLPKHWEPWETIRTDLVNAYGKTGTAPIDAIGSTTAFPLTLTTFRVTEHFQAGQTTRNNTWLNELVPAPVIEINSADAYTKGITNGAPVYVDTARQTNIGPFKAVVGSGSGATQRVKKGVVAIPWHWGNKGLSTGATANDVTIDAVDSNTQMPEYKVCLCNIHL